jgi:hypothetical protein
MRDVALLQLRMDNTSAGADMGYTGDLCGLFKGRPRGPLVYLWA